MKTDNPDFLKDKFVAQFQKFQKSHIYVPFRCAYPTLPGTQYGSIVLLYERYMMCTSQTYDFGIKICQKIAKIAIFEIWPPGAPPRGRGWPQLSVRGLKKGAKLWKSTFSRKIGKSNNMFCGGSPSPPFNQNATKEQIPYLS